MYKEPAEYRVLLYRQYSREYGELTPAGEHQINESVKFYDGQARGTVVWKYQDAWRGLVYIIEDYSGFRFAIAADEMISNV
ncbi:MAG TPA: hypothetical protein VHZ51_00525 [Ktedonobacteraceae bacterium]|jgi:hypothetical protein|nr:hypothetical protein [Ktedonobacteraceae bacterium]